MLFYYDIIMEHQISKENGVTLWAKDIRERACFFSKPQLKLTKTYVLLRVVVWVQK